ncbi:MAG: DNA primase regulatory subunit PriL, partial [Nitrososphaeria archaeon]|nr:DNA primase regulatory subunit PriL [Nitrososphaeria archaeon]
MIERVDKLKRKYAGQIGKAEFAEFRGEVDNEAFPPCISRLYEAAKSGRHISHLGRFTLTSFLVRIGMKPADIVDLFRSSSDFNERMT